MHGVVLTSDRDPVRPAILWLDQRAAAEADRYAELPDSLTGGLGNRPSAGMAGPILCWLAEYEPENVAAAQWALQPKDWIRLQLTGEAATDPTDASGTLLYDLKRDAWADDLIAALGLPHDKLPRSAAPPSRPARCSRAPPPSSACRQGYRSRPAPPTPPPPSTRRTCGDEAMLRSAAAASGRSPRPSSGPPPPPTCIARSATATTGSPRSRMSA